MSTLADVSAILEEMGYNVYDIERAYIGGYKTVEEIIEFFSSGGSSLHLEESSNRLKLPSAQRTYTSAFNPRPVYVNLSDMQWSEQTGDTNLPSSTGACAEEPNAEPVQSRISSTSVQERFEFEQRESRKLADALRKEKLMEERERERLRAEIAAERQARILAHQSTSLAPVTTGSSTVNCPPDNVVSSGPRDKIKLKIILFDRTHAPCYIELDQSNSYADLLSHIQPNLTANPPARNVPSVDTLSTSNPFVQALDQHLVSLSTTDPCVHLLVQTWPRRELTHPCARTPEPDPEIMTQRLTEMQITNGTTIAVRHVNCEFQTKVMERISELNDLRPRSGPEFITPASPPPPPPAPVPDPDPPGEDEPEDYPMEPVFPIQNPRFPGQGQQLRPQAPDGAIPASALSVQENVRRAALNLEERLRSTTATPTAPSDPASECSSWAQVPTLVKLCLHSIHTWVTQYADALSAARLGLIHETTSRTTATTGTRYGLTVKQSDQASIDQRRMEHWVAHHLSGMRWPNVLGQQLVRSLMDEKCFTARTAVLLRNSMVYKALIGSSRRPDRGLSTEVHLYITTTLIQKRSDVGQTGHYILTSTELIQCLADRWTGLVDLRLDSDHPYQIATEGICDLSRLQNLKSLSVCGLHSVNDETLPHILELRQLRVLCLSDTKVSDEGWTRSWSAEQSSQSCGERPLLKLELARMGPLFTDSGLCAVAQLFPRLQSLSIARSDVSPYACTLIYTYIRSPRCRS
ncbi:unnamed protein product [Echinostoma caproni]|uniref:UBX domain-containing protein n=1 Tax=Echinostoma caproni TaxID=27848 RepID=A0A183AQX0_9TREM|nr:unnamed protein product [Echinostoma caproni]